MEASRSIQPHALRIKSCLSFNKILQSEKVSSYSFLFIKEKVAKGDEPLILLSGEEWCVNCVKLAPRLKGNIPAGKVIFELDTSETNKEKNVLISALAKSKSFTKIDSKGELKKTRPVFPSLWRIDGDLSDVSKVLVEEAAGADNVSHWLDNPPKRINHADWLGL